MAISPGQILEGAYFKEPMRVETITPEGPGRWTLGLVAIHSEKFQNVHLTDGQIAELVIRPSAASYKGNPDHLCLGLQAYILGIAYEFDPYFGLSVSRVDPLPHQLEAVYEHLLKTPRVRFLLADDAGAGKTIMAGLLIRELKLRGLADRILIVCPANLTFQWQRELREKFGEQFKVLNGTEIRSQFGVNPWAENKLVITSMDLARMDHVQSGLKQAHWELVIVDEAHRMSASSEENRTLRYRLGELLRDASDHILLLTATPHKGDPATFSLFLRLLDDDVYGDVSSIKEAMKRRHAPFYLRRTKEAMVYFPERQPDGTSITRPIFTRRFPETVQFQLTEDEFTLYKDITRFLKKRAAIAAAKEEADPRARAVGFLVTLFQRRLASSANALKCTLDRRVKILQKKLKNAVELSTNQDIQIPSDDDMDEMSEEDREIWEDKIEALTLAQNPDEVNDEIEELKRFSSRVEDIMSSIQEAKLKSLFDFLKKNGFVEDEKKRLLIFTEFKDTLTYLVEKLKDWGFKVGFIHGSMKPGNRDEPGTRLNAEAQFWSGETQVLVATEAAGEGINLQCCHIMVNYDIPWNPNRLEQRMGRIHRYGQKEDCLIFNFVAGNTVEGHVLRTLLERLQSIRDALEDDAVFNVVGEILPAAHIDRILREYYAGKLGDSDLEDRILHNVNEDKFRSICKNALEGLATKKLNLALLVERQAKAREKRMVPETMARFLGDASSIAGMTMKPVSTLAYSFDPGPTPHTLKRFEMDKDWGLLPVGLRYHRLSTDKDTAAKNTLEWVTPGHPLFESLRRNACEATRQDMQDGACFYSLNHDHPARLDIYRARVVDGLGNIVHERTYGVEIAEGVDPVLRDSGFLGDLLPAPMPEQLPPVARSQEATAFLHEKALGPFLEEVRKERVDETERVAAHIEISLTELIAKEDEKIGRFTEEKGLGIDGAAGRLAVAETRDLELTNRRTRRRLELEKQKHMTLQNVERITTVLILPHPERNNPELCHLRSDPEVEAIAMEVVRKYEEEAGRKVEDVHLKNLGYDITSVDLNSGELRLIEVKGLSAPEGNIILTPNEYRVANDRRDCFWLYVVTDCRKEPRITFIQDPARFKWASVVKIEHYTKNLGEMRKTA